MLLLVSATNSYSQTKPGSTASSDAEIIGTVRFLTLRNRTGSNEADEYFGGERDILRAGECQLTTTPLASMKFIAENVPFYVPDEVVDLDAVREVPLQTFWQDIRRSAAGRRPLLYVHGFYIGFERSCKRAALFQNNLDLAGRMVLFSWPSDGVIINYIQDEADLYWSVKPIRETLADMASRFGNGKIDVVGHSLGSRGLVMALAALAEAGGNEPPLFNQLVLIAPDIDAGIFKQYLAEIRPLVKRITLYVSANDNPLAISRELHGHPRLGETGEHLNGLDGVEIIDVSNIPVRYISGHVYHLYHQTVIRDLEQLINHNRPAAQRSNLKLLNKGYWQLQAEN